MSFPTDQTAFARSLKTFKQGLSSSDIEAFEFSTYEDFKKAVGAIEKEQSQRRGVRNLNKVRPFMNFLRQYTSVIEQFVNARAEYLAFIWGPMKVCLQIAVRLTDAFDFLLDAYARIGDSLPILAAIDNLFSAQNSHFAYQILANIYEDILNFHSRALVFFKQKTWTIAFKTAFRSHIDILGDIVKNLQRSKELLIQTTSVWHFQEAQATRRRLTEEFEAKRVEDEHNRKSFVIGWLSHSPCYELHQGFQRERRMYPATTHWLFDTTQTSEWLRASETGSSILWIHGIPGTGKTFLFSAMIDKIEESLPNSQVIYFYCRHNEPHRTNFNDILRTLIGQILALNATCLQYLYDSMIGGVERRSSSMSGLCSEMLEKLVLHHDQLFIGIDGIDECQELERQQVLHLLNRITQNSKDSGNVRIFLTSRKEKDIAFSLRSAYRLEIKHYHTEKDIIGYARERSRSLTEKFSLSIEHQTRIVTDITARAHGMFLLVRLIMDNLMDQDCHEDLEKELDTDVLPNGIDQAYSRILDRMQKKNHPKRRWDRAKLGLDILTIATRPLKAHEIQAALSICLEDRSIDFARRKSVIPVEELLGPMVELHLDGSVDFIHRTARDYLLQHHSDRYIDIWGARSRLALLCTSFLTNPCSSPKLDKPDIKNSVLRGDYALQEYAVQNWIYHVNDFHCNDTVENNTDSAKLDEMVLSLYFHHIEQYSSALSPQDINAATAKEDIVSNAINVCQESYRSIDDIRATDARLVPYLLRQVLDVRIILEELSPQQRKESPLVIEAYGKSIYKCPKVYCARFNQGFLTRKSRDEHLQVHERAYKCTEQSCDYLVIGFPTNGELVKHQDICHHESSERYIFPAVKRTSLSNSLKSAIDDDNALAVREVYTEMLLHPSDETGFLFRAVKRKCFAAALALLELAAPNEIHYRARDWQTLLHEAAGSVSVELLERFLYTDIDVNAQDKDGNTALTVALERENFDAVRLLWTRTGSDFKTPIPWRYRRALRKAFIGASSHGHYDIVGRILGDLMKDVGDNHRGLSPTVSRALSQAALHNHESTINEIIRVGAKMQIEKYYSTRLKESISQGIEGLKLLEGPQIDQNGKTKGNELAKAARKDDVETVLRLLESGANINYGSPQLYNALGAAARHDKLSMVQLLLEKGADVNAQGGGYGSALQAASASGHEDIVQMLLEKGADVNTQGGVYGNVLQAAIAGGHEDIVQMLLENGADINVRGKIYSDALQAASFKGHDKIVQILLENGADINAQARDGLSTALGRGHEKAAHFLQEKIAGANAQAKVHPSSPYQNVLLEDSDFEELVDNDAVQFRDKDGFRLVDEDVHVFDNS